ncbi:unnamed protein product [Penicillium camemberti]|uniref:Str. FM013 n=1 Tax=Penicillium camemberti (strain FM 013) TaxID=1429867 RepID=A0A0G4P6E2_PENC3|nr:unnamed protein product [Penicillium camemberti]
MLMELIDMPELNSFIVVKDNELNAIENLVTGVTQLRQLEVKPFTRPNLSSVRLTNAPPRGVTAAQYVEKWREYKPERSNNGNCSYCGSETYGIPTCWYLYLAKRHLRWIPRLGIWVFNRKIGGNGTSATVSTPKDFK